MFELDDVGKKVHARVPIMYTHVDIDTKIAMVIKAPRGTLTLFDKDYISPDTQCEAIRAFMEEHSDDQT